MIKSSFCPELEIPNTYVMYMCCVSSRVLILVNNALRELNIYRQDSQARFFIGSTKLTPKLPFKIKVYRENENSTLHIHCTILAQNS